MKSKHILIILIAIPAFLYSQTQSDTSWQYLNQKPPGPEPEVFAPGIISGKGRIHCFPAISPDGKEIYWMLLPPKIMFTKYEGGKWSVPQEAAFSKDIICLRPSISYDNKRIYFSSKLPDGYGSLDIYLVERTGTGFSQPVNCGTPVNSPHFEAQQTFTNDGTIYYTGKEEGKKWNRGILRVKFVNNKYSAPETLEFPINIPDTNAIDYTPFISRDESFLLFSSNRQNSEKESCRIFISFRDENDNWSEPINLSEKIGFDFDSRDPYISPDQKYLFFSSGKNIYWLSTDVIKKVNIN